MTFKVIASLIFVAFLVVAPAHSAGLGDKAIPFTLPDIKGNPHSLSEWEGNVIVLNFWATWCPSCIKEIPEFMALQEKFGEKGLQFIGIAVDDVNEVKHFVDMQAINYPILVGELEGADLAFLYGNRVGVLPFSVILNRDGHVISTHKGSLSPQRLEQTVLPLL